MNRPTSVARASLPARRSENAGGLVPRRVAGRAGIEALDELCDWLRRVRADDPRKLIGARAARPPVAFDASSVIM